MFIRLFKYMVQLPIIIFYLIQMLTFRDFIYVYIYFDNGHIQGYIEYMVQKKTQILHNIRYIS